MLRRNLILVRKMTTEKSKEKNNDELFDFRYVALNCLIGTTLGVNYGIYDSNRMNSENDIQFTFCGAALFGLLGGSLGCMLSQKKVIKYTIGITSGLLIFSSPFVVYNYYYTNNKKTKTLL